MNSTSSISKKLRRRFRYGLITKLLQDRLKNIGIKILPYYLVEEKLHPDLKDRFMEGFDLYQTRELGVGDMPFIASIRHRESPVEPLLDQLNEGKKCFGVAKDGDLAAFTWANFKECHFNGFLFALKENEAYLFDAFTLENYRGQGLAPFVRYCCYGALNELGKDIFYSVSEYFNTPSIKFKKKLKARFLSLHLYVGIRDKYQWRWQIKSFK